MKKMTEDETRETHTRSPRKGKIETPPMLTDEDEAALDAAWKGANSGGGAKKARLEPKK